MSLMCWNCQGQGRSQDLTINKLMEVRKKYFPELFFLMETMHSRNVLVDIQVWLGYDRVYTVNPIGKSGGLAVFWKQSVNIEVISLDKNLIDLGVQIGENKFFVSCIYGDPNESKRHIVWERVSRIGIIRKNPWCMIGDFNSICSNDEKIGGPNRCDSTFVDFNNMFKFCEMNQLVSQGNPFTWSGKRGKLWIQCKLDRCFGNKGWLQLFSGANQVFLDKRGSDHMPVLVNLVNSCDERRGRFRFDKSLINLSNVKNNVINAWKGKRGGVACNVAERVRRCRRALCNWKRNFNLNAKDKILRIQEELEAEESLNFPRRHIILCLKHELMKAYRHEESFWSQRSTEKWMKCGDKNSKKIHASVNMARSKNGIDILEDKNGMEHRSEDSKGEIASSYFQELFSSINPSDFGALFMGFTSRVT
ncbi:hypothetical protein N665_0566s0021 [Sinapis alba]|nr:hypothetical protein N665_0566s0021 [Sinapis alba]